MVDVVMFTTDGGFLKWGTTKIVGLLLIMLNKLNDNWGFPILRTAQMLAHQRFTYLAVNLSESSYFAPSGQ